LKPIRWILILITALALMAAPQTTKSSTNKQTTGSKESSKSASGNLIDINTASAAELKALPGIGDAYSAAIIKNRPYANKRQLLSRKVIPQATYDKISDQIVARQTKK